MTRDEYLRKLRGEFIDRHLALPGWMERLPPWLRECFRILYWVFFRPSALRLYLARLAQEGGMEEAAGWKLLRRLVKALKEAHKSSSALGEAAEELPALLNTFVSLAGSPKIGVLPLFPREAPNFPEVLKGLCLFEKAAQAFTAYQAASGELARRDYLNEALSALDRVRQMAAESPDVPQPFAALLLLISERWYQTVAAERDRLLALRPVSPLEDFYVVGLPLTPESGRLFVGRDEIFQRLEELFRNPFQKGPVVLYGQRRMGKTSILRHIGVRLGPSYIPVLADLQGLLSDPYRPIRSDRDLWLALMREIGKPLGVSPREGESVEEFLDRIAPARGERFIVLML
jgi:hypothetical protein